MMTQTQTELKPIQTASGDEEQRDRVIARKSRRSDWLFAVGGLIVLFLSMGLLLALLLDLAASGASRIDYEFLTSFPSRRAEDAGILSAWVGTRSEEHTSELQSLMRISYAVLCLKKKKTLTS